MRGLNFLHRQIHRVFRPVLPSPYLYGDFGRVLRKTLKEYASTAKVAVEFGVLYGYTTHLIAKALPPGAKFYSYDTNDIPELLGKIGRKDIEVHLEQKDIFDWLNQYGWVDQSSDFDFMWIDIGATPYQMGLIHERLKPYLERSVVLSEGTRRRDEDRVIKVPHKEISPIPPGLFRMMP